MSTSEGTAHVTVTATATPTASSVEIIEQTEANVARILFPVEVTLAPPAFTMSADDTDIVEGMSGRLTVSASRPVSMDTDVMIVRDGTRSAGADDYRLDPMTVTIEASAMSGHTLVEAVEGGTAEEGEVLTLFAVVDGVQMPDVSVSFRLFDAAVSRRCRSSRRSCWPRSSLSADTGATCGGGSAAGQAGQRRDPARMWQGDQRPREAVVLVGGAGVTRRLPHPPATRTAFEVALSSVDRHTGVTTPPPPAAARRPAAPRARATRRRAPRRPPSDAQIVGDGAGSAPWGSRDRGWIDMADALTACG